MSGTWRSPASSADTTGPRAKCDSVVYEAIAKASEIIVQARSGPSFSRNNANATARFNLHVPEVESVRSILQRWRRSLHVPLRLDVYYQHDDGSEQRELLERWCLTYEGGAADMEQQFKQECISSDPIVQLRHVCKKIVVWLRSLYTMCRLLPSHRLVLQQTKLHFSMDIEGVLQDLPQFQHTALPAVLTPYGPLYWRVWYAPNVTRLLKQNARGAVSRPIPMTKRQQQPDASYIRVPKQAYSAPAHYQTLSDATGGGALQYGTSHPVRAGAAARRMPVGRSNSLVEDESETQYQQTARPLVQRSNSMKPDEDVSSPASLSKPRSGLSLAMMEHESASAQARRTALHHPPPATTQQHAQPAEHSYGYGYNQVLPPSTARALTPTTPQPAFSSSPTSTPPPLSSTPPAFAHVAPGPLIPPRNLSSAAPPFSGLPTVLSEPELGQQQYQGEAEDHNDSLSILAPISSLDLLHSSPFKAGGGGGGSVLSSLLTESSVLKHSMKLSGMAQHHHQIVVPGRKFSRDEDDYDGDDDMPFAVQQPSENLQESAVASLAHKCATASRLQLFESSVVEQPKSDDNTSTDMVSSLADQLAEFRTFGASLHVSTPTMTPIHSRRGSDASAGAGAKQSGGANDGSTSTLISTRS